ncbi:MAG TPA: aldo/keto reductase [Verrucomicrobiaceae bacterium]
MKTIRFSDGAVVPAIGQGTWKMGQGERNRDAEVAALRRGIELGLTLIDTAEMYGEGAAEEIVGEAIKGRRDGIFVVTKVYPHNASNRGLPAACERSLKRLGAEVIDLYLLHWRGDTPMSETVEAFEKLRDLGKIRRWGVSNFDVDDMENLNRPDCATNQVLYNPARRGIEFDLLPWCARRQMPVMAYSPVGQGGRLLQQTALKEIGKRHGATPAQIALAWALRQPGVMVIPKAGDESHQKENASAGELILERQDLEEMDRAFPPPTKKRSLEML